LNFVPFLCRDSQHLAQIFVQDLGQASQALLK
jgi:hypothetical protein